MTDEHGLAPWFAFLGALAFLLSYNMASHRGLFINGCIYAICLNGCIHTIVLIGLIKIFHDHNNDAIIN